MACTTKQRRTRRTIVAVLGGALLLGATGLAAAGELAPWMTDPAFGARRDAFGPGVHRDATGSRTGGGAPACRRGMAAVHVFLEHDEGQAPALARGFVEALG